MPRLRITYTVTTDEYHDFDVNGDSRCDRDHAIKRERERLKEEVEATGARFQYQSWYVTKFGG